ncbi:MAG TPA: glycosyltransferase family 4 protein [Verrucomicrobiae bacterium]|jgi:glycosyltransferase involved in cell wall biosynthesis
MKLLVFAHTPPPHHGQSYMVKLMLEGLGGDCRKSAEKRGSDLAKAYGVNFRIECYHVNARFSKTLEDVGEFHAWKMLLVFFYCLQAIWCRYRYGVTTIYYVPAPGKAVALYRDWLVMLLCRPFFEKIILHWHAAGLAKWLETSVQIRSRAMTYRLFKPVTLSIVLSKYNLADAKKLLSDQICVVNNGIPDPCPDFVETVLPRRRARFLARQKLLTGEAISEYELAKTGDSPQTVRVLYLAHCTREKGLFAAMEGIAAVNRDLAERNSPIRMKLFVAGTFVTADEQLQFGRLMQSPEYAAAVEYLGFVSDARKQQALRDADLFCFPTQYLGENQPVNLIEAMAFGLPVVTTQWRSLPEMFPPGYAGLIPGQAPQQIADALSVLMTQKTGEQLRENFLGHFTVERHLASLAKAIRSTE